MKRYEFLGEVGDHVWIIDAPFYRVPRIVHAVVREYTHNYIYNATQAIVEHDRGTDGPFDYTKRIFLPFDVDVEIFASQSDAEHVLESILSELEV